MASPYVPLAPEVDAFRRQVEDVALALCTLADSLTDEQFAWRPAPEAWSIEDCIEHLNAVARLYLPVIDDGIADTVGKSLYSGGPFRYNLLGRALVWFTEPPPRLRLRTRVAYAPGPKRPRTQVMAGFRAFQVQYVDRLRQASGLHLARGRARTPMLPWLRVPLGSAFALAIAHERRHLWQARRIAAHPQFPPHR